ncbi:helicase-associated domain-containing protein [Corynebacterium urogenitale]
MNSSAQGSLQPHSEDDLTYPDWLASHTDEDIAQLLWRLYSHGSTALLEQFRGSAHPEPALRHLSSLELAILHAATEVGAGSHPATIDDLKDALTELFDIAGTPHTARPSQSEIDEAIVSLARWGLLFGPTFQLTNKHTEKPTEPNARTTTLSGSTTLKIPAHIPPDFDPATEQLWRLADCNRCPIPTTELPTTIEALPPRQRRLLSTLSAAGGVGHSATLRPDADPNAPLPTMVRQGLLDQLDESTTRLSGRVSAYLRGTLISPAGGIFSASNSWNSEFPNSATPAAEISSDPRDPAADASAVASIVQRIQELTDTITDLGAHPIQPLSGGGVGLRELNKIARRRNLPTEQVIEQITDLYLANFLAREFPEPAPADDTGRTYWAVTDSALAFLQAPLATQWAMLLLGWAGSPYTAWMADEEDNRPLSPELHADRAAELRTLFSELFHTASTDRQAADELWRMRPALAWETQQRAWETIVKEATRFGLLASHGVHTQPLATRALEALATTLHQYRAALARGEPMPTAEALSTLSLQLNELLPDPVSYLIIQGDHTIMAPGLLSAENQQMLAGIAEQESSGMASVWRVTKDSLLRAFEAGISLADIETFLDRMAPGGLSAVPQSLRYLVTDTHRAHARGEATSVAAPSVPSVSRVPTPPRTRCDLTVSGSRDLPQQIAGAVESFRRSHNATTALDPNDGTSTVDTRTVRTPRDVMSELRRAYSAGTQVRLHYVDYAGATSQEWISIVMMTPSSISAVVEATGETISVQPHRIAAVDVPR